MFKVAQLTIDQNLESITAWLANNTINSIVAVVPVNSMTLIIFYT